MVWKVPMISASQISKALDAFVSRIRSLIVFKGHEYARPHDSLSNFREGMHLTGLPADVYMLSLMAKHVLWFYEKAKHNEPPDAQQFAEHACDIILYLTLLYTLYYGEDEQSSSSQKEDQE